MNLRGQIRTLCLVTAPSHVLADCWGGYRWGCLGAVSCNYNYSGPAAKSQHCWVHSRPARTKLSWLTRGVCQVSPAAVLNIVWIMSAILFIKTRTGPPLPLQGPGLVSVWPLQWPVGWGMAPATAVTACRDTAVLQCHRSISLILILITTFSRQNIRVGVSNGLMQVQMDHVPELDKINWFITATLESFPSLFGQTAPMPWLMPAQQLSWSQSG